MEQRYILHAGIKGMKWGVRRFQNKDGTLTPVGKKRYRKEDSYSEDHKSARSKSYTQMSNAELRKANERLQLEQQYKSLTAKKKGAGRKWVESILTESGKDIAKSYVTKYGKMAVEATASIVANKLSERNKKWVL